MKIGIIKLGAMGDVIRTLSVLPALKKKYPDSEITWITKNNIADLVKTVKGISSVHTLPVNPADFHFDILLNFDVEDEASYLAEKIDAGKKFGFRKLDGFPAAFNLSAEYYLNTMFDDELKKNNKKTYQEMMFEAAELNYCGEHCRIVLDESSVKYAKNFAGKNNLTGKRLIGIHMGAGPRWPSKAWHPDRVKEFISGAATFGFEIILFGGPEEKAAHTTLIDELSAEGIKIHHNDSKNTNLEFASLVNLCEKMVCSDSFALHVSLALRKEAICLFFCTSPYEIEGYGLLKKVISPKLYEFFPERMNEYNEELVLSISAQSVLSELTNNNK